MSAAKFEPSKHLRNIKGKGGNAEYLDVKWRLVWLRSEYPDATTTIEHIEISPDIAIFRATVTIPSGGGATDYGSETPKDFGDFIEKAATKALGRALAQLGYGIQFVGEELDEGERIVDSPVDRPQPAPQRRTPPPPSSSRPAVAPSGGGPSSPAEAWGIAYTKEEYEAAIKTAWKMQEAGDTYPAIVAYMRTHRDRLTNDQLEDSREEVRLIKAAIYPDVLAVAG